MRTKPIPGTKYYAGTVIREDGRMGRHLVILFRCARCKDGVGRARFTCLKAANDKKYQTKSCGCRERKCFEDYHRSKAQQMDEGTMKTVFECCATESTDVAAQRFGISAYLANFVWQRWCRRLEELPELYRRQIYEHCQRSMQLAAKKFRLTAAELLRICFDWQRSVGLRPAAVQTSDQARQVLRAEAYRQFALHAPIGSLTGFLHSDAQLYLETALAVSQMESFDLGRYPGELAVKELSMGKRRSDYGWVYKTMMAMHKYQVKDCFGGAGEDFMKLCRWSLAQRRQRRRDYLNGMDRLSKAKKGKNPLPKRRVTYLPTPTTPPVALALLIVDYVPVLMMA